MIAPIANKVARVVIGVFCITICCLCYGDLPFGGLHMQEFRKQCTLYGAILETVDVWPWFVRDGSLVTLPAVGGCFDFIPGIGDLLCKIIKTT